VAEVHPTPHNALQRTVDEITGYSRRTRRLIWGLIATTVLDIALTVVLGFTVSQANNASTANTQLVKALHTAQLTVCANGNTFRANQTTIWQDFVKIITKPAAGEPAAQIAKANTLAAEFLAYVATVNHPVNCTALYGK
jgi:hypothetical protein